jgi:hypothetical protein
MKTLPARANGRPGYHSSIGDIALDEVVYIRENYGNIRKRERIVSLQHNSPFRLIMPTSSFDPSYAIPQPSLTP